MNSNYLLVDDLDHLLTIPTDTSVCWHYNFKSASPVHRRVNTAGLRLPSWARPMCRLSPGPVSGNWGFGRVPTALTAEGFPVPELLYGQCGVCRNICLPAASLEFGRVPTRKGLCEQPPVRSLAGEFPVSFPSGHFSRVVTSLMLCDSTEGDSWKPTPSFLYTSPVPFAICSAPLHCDKSQPQVPQVLLARPLTQDYTEGLGITRIKKICPHAVCSVTFSKNALK